MKQIKYLQNFCILFKNFKVAYGSTIYNRHCKTPDYLNTCKLKTY